MRDTAIPSCYFSTAENVSRATTTEARQTGTMAFVAKKIFLTKGVGKHRERLSSFELALGTQGLRRATSSASPPFSLPTQIDFPQRGLKHIRPGQSRSRHQRKLHQGSAQAHRCRIGLALPSDKSMYGYLSEHHSSVKPRSRGEYAEELAAEMLATTLNVEFDPDCRSTKKKKVYRISNKNRPHHERHAIPVATSASLTTVLGAAILIGRGRLVFLLRPGARCVGSPSCALCVLLLLRLLARSAFAADRVTILTTPSAAIRRSPATGFLRPRRARRQAHPLRTGNNPEIFEHNVKPQR